MNENLSMLKVALTGNRYAGKDTVAKMFQKIGIPVFNADVTLKFILNYKIEVETKIKRELGSGVYTQGFIDPAKFDSAQKVNRLIDIVEADWLQAYDKFSAKYHSQIYTIFHSSIFFERKDLERNFDIVINVFAPKEERIHRCKHVTDLPLTEIHELMGSELDELSKNRDSDYIVHNYSAGADLVKQVNVIDKQIIEAYIKDKQTNILPANKFVM